MGIPQGSPISPIPYLFYNADLIEACTDSAWKIGTTAFVDDANLLTYSQSAEANAYVFERMHKKCLEWGRTHGSKFNVSKYALIHLARGRKSRKAVLRLGSVGVKPSKELRLLGVWLDPKLEGKAHMRRIEAKAYGLVAALWKVTRSTWGTSVLASREVYLQYTYRSCASLVVH